MIKTLLTVALIFWHSPAFALIVKAVSPNSGDGAATPSFFFAATGGASTTAFIDTQALFPSQIDLTKTSTTDTGTNALLFDVTTEASFSPTGAQRIFLTVEGRNSTDQGAAPIGFAGAATGIPPSCTSGGACYTSTQSNLAAVVTPGQTIRIAVYPQDICNYGKQNAASNPALVNGCASATNVFGSTGTDAIATISVRFHAFIATVPKADGTVDSGATEESEFAYLNIQRGAPSLNCNTAQLGSLYYPSDGSINLDPSVLNTNGFYSPAVSGAGAPITAVLVTTQLNGSNLPNSTNYFTLGGYQTFGPGDQPTRMTGFINTTNGSDNSYTLSLAVRDQAGMISPYTSGCQLTGVRTSVVQTFVQSSKCFIATGAFRTAQGWQLTLLRQFRDDVLLTSSFGKKFVSFYYKYGESAGIWVYENPFFRFPILVLLLPLQIFASFILFFHELILPVQLLVLSALLGGIALLIVRQKKNVH